MELTNPWAKKTLNLTRQMEITRENPILAQRLETEAKGLDAEESRKAHTRSIAEFNTLDKEAKIRFIQNDGELSA